MFHQALSTHYTHEHQERSKTVPISHQLRTDLVAPDWQDAACKDEPITTWDYEIEGAYEPAEVKAERYARALSICASCPIRRECYDWAKSRGECGIWGGQVFPPHPAYHLVKCEECGVRIYSVRVDSAAARETAGRGFFCHMCLGDR